MVNRHISHSGGKEMKKPKVSIIIPAYNAAKTLATAVESVLAESLDELEVIIVNDGSKDNTGEVADELAAKDSRVRVIHQSNQGPLNARLNGLHLSEASYVGFMDADDTVGIRMHERLLSFAEENNLDVVECDYQAKQESHSPIVIRGLDAVRTKIVRPWLFEGNGSAFVWNKIYKRSCLKTDFDVPYCVLFDDLILNLVFFRNVTSFGHIYENFYNYQVNSNSVTRNFSRRSISDFKVALYARKYFASDYNIAVDDKMFARWTLLNAGNLMKMAARSVAQSNRERIDNIKEILSVDEVAAAVKRCSPSFRMPISLFVFKTRLTDILHRWCSCMKHMIKKLI